MRIVGVGVGQRRPRLLALRRGAGFEHVDEPVRRQPAHPTRQVAVDSLALGLRVAAAGAVQQHVRQRFAQVVQIEALLTQRVREGEIEDFVGYRAVGEGRLLHDEGFDAGGAAVVNQRLGCREPRDDVALVDHVGAREVLDDELPGLAVL